MPITKYVLPLPVWNWFRSLTSEDEACQMIEKPLREVLLATNVKMPAAQVKEDIATFAIIFIGELYRANDLYHAAGNAMAPFTLPEYEEFLDKEDALITAIGHETLRQYAVFSGSNADSLKPDIEEGLV